MDQGAVQCRWLNAAPEEVEVRGVWNILKSGVLRNHTRHERLTGPTLPARIRTQRSTKSRGNFSAEEHRKFSPLLALSLPDAGDDERDLQCPEY